MHFPTSGHILLLPIIHPRPQSQLQCPRGHLDGCHSVSVAPSLLIIFPPVPLCTMSLTLSPFGLGHFSLWNIWLKVSLSSVAGSKVSPPIASQLLTANLPCPKLAVCPLDHSALDVLTPPCGYVFMAVPKPYELFRRGMTLSISQSPVSVTGLGM